MSSIVVVALVLVAGAAYWLWPRGRADRHPRRATRARGGAGHARDKEPAPAFAGVRIRLGTGACAAAQALAEQHFLVDEAPALPLAGCAQARCRCTFEKLADRRIESRRWADEGLSATIFSADERRAGVDRRDDGSD
jgi:hypothetical protein